MYKNCGKWGGGGGMHLLTIFHFENLVVINGIDV